VGTRAVGIGVISDVGTLHTWDAAKHGVVRVGIAVVTSAGEDDASRRGAMSLARVKAARTAADGTQKLGACEVRHVEVRCRVNGGRG